MKYPHNISRVEAFSDAVLAFAATLLVVSISDENNTSVLQIKLVSFVGFIVSFFVLVLLWKAHYNFFRRTQYIDNWIIGINSVFLFVALYFVFPLKSLINSMFQNKGVTPDKLGSLFELYGLAILLLFSCFSLMYYRAYKKDSSNDERIELLFYSRHFLIFVLVSIMSILMAWSKIWLMYGGAGFAYFVLGPACHFHAVWFDKKYRI